MRRTFAADPEALIVVGGFHYQLFAFPVADRIAMEARIDILGTGATIHIYGSIGMRSADTHHVNTLQLGDVDDFESVRRVIQPRTARRLAANMRIVGRVVGPAR